MDLIILCSDCGRELKSKEVSDRLYISPCKYCMENYLEAVYREIEIDNMRDD